MGLAAALAPERLPPQLLHSINSGPGSPLAIPAPIVERVIAILIHAFSCLLIVYAVQVKAWKWFWVSFSYKTAVDALAGFIHLTYGLERATGSTLAVWLTEFAFLPFAIGGAWGVWLFRNRWKGPPLQLHTSDEETLEAPP